ncbi:cysteine--tRNA ligase [Persicimonas caeni]|uniref:Cysteine--tRNA ligase n=1 Tax=Persicimonas caeni TaxID=2292766 RepID=A0A4Y6PT57_PERCE|nr:cysteine--tRNA ligase [Persicimonas caeni]QDG51502.1 cysteine--tRNA ligase [Persicimonas caeni]QED32723.1 cysteine--tRNA ligase [Persicimonas caeni]
MAADTATELREIKIFDTLSGDKKVLEPIEPGKVGMYVCGVTVYDLTHIGHARVFVVFDVVQRFLRHVGYDVTYVRNHTDVDDKIIERANEVGKDPLELAQNFIEELDRDMGALGVAHADEEPKVSTHIDAIIDMVEKLVDNGYAYESDGDVYYRVEKFDGYGKLSHRKLEDMESGRSGRVEAQAADKKEHPFDFTLWKKSKEGEPSWESPWGQGRPGWHIECSAMSTTYLGATFDIHGGGRDLVFPHHENEIAQSEGATGQEFAKSWMHVGMVNVSETTDDGEKIERKMSKSLGNFWTTRDVLQGFHPEAVRYFFHTTHYRKPITYSLENLEEATDRVEYYYTTLKRIDDALARAEFSMDNPPAEANWVEGTDEVLDGFHARFEGALADDFNTPRAIAVLGEVAKVGNELTQSNKKPGADVAWTLYNVGKLMRHAGGVLGVLGREPMDALLEIRDLKAAALDIDPADIDQKIAERKEARANKDWDRADAIRDELAAMDVEIMDRAEGTSWRFK